MLLLALRSPSGVSLLSTSGSFLLDGTVYFLGRHAFEFVLLVELGKELQRVRLLRLHVAGALLHVRLNLLRSQPFERVLVTTLMALRVNKEVGVGRKRRRRGQQSGSEAGAWAWV